MRTKTRFDRSTTVQRGAFTLVELMVVITIIAALMALAGSAVMKFLAVQQANNTQSTLDRVQSQLIRAWSKAKNVAKNESIPPHVYSLIQGSLTMKDANAPDRIRVIYIKLKMRSMFPMNFGEALNVPYYNPTLGATVPSSPVPAQPGYVSYLATLGITPALVSAQPFPQPYESSACLLMALQRGVSGAGIDPSQLTAGGAASSAATPSGSSIPYLTDAWGRPIFFSRAPAGNLYLNPGFPAGWPGANDPGDPQGLLQTPLWGTTFGPLFTQLTLQYVAPPNSSYKLAPMVASGGPINWTKTGTLTFNPITFAPVPGADALFSTP